MLEINRDKLSSQRAKHQKKAAGKKAQKGVMMERVEEAGR